MEKISAYQYKKIEKKFKHLNDLLENEIEHSELGYYEYSISVFTHWLKPSECTREMNRIYRYHHEETENKRMDVLHDMFNDEFYYLGRRGNFSFKDRNEFKKFISYAFLIFCQITLIDAKNQILIYCGGDEYTDHFSFCNIGLVSELQELATKHGLFLLKST